MQIINQSFTLRMMTWEELAPQVIQWIRMMTMIKRQNIVWIPSKYINLCLLHIHWAVNNYIQFLTLFSIRYANVKTPERHVRTRLYFTSVSIMFLCDHTLPTESLSLSIIFTNKAKIDGCAFLLFNSIQLLIKNINKKVFFKDLTIHLKYKILSIINSNMELPSIWIRMTYR